MNWENHLENPTLKIEKNNKNSSEIALCEQKYHQREGEFLFKHIFLTLI